MPPIQTEYFLSGGATTLIFMVLGARAVNSFVIRSPIPINIVVPKGSIIRSLLTRILQHLPTSGKNNVGIEILPDINVALHD